MQLVVNKRVQVEHASTLEKLRAITKLDTIYSGLRCREFAYFGVYID